MATPMKPRTIEREFGVPIPGLIQDPSLWTQTALKKLPEEGPLDWQALFGRQAPLVLDIGCGNGRFLVGSALSRPEYDHLGIDILPMVLRYATRRANQRGLSNVRWAACDGQRLLERHSEPCTFREIHCYHPQPYHDASQASKRLFTPAFLGLLHDRLEEGGLFVMQTDNGPYWQYLRTMAESLFVLTNQEGPWAETPRGRTRREILARRRGLAVFRAWGIKRGGLSALEIAERLAALPMPDFDAGPARHDLDALEQEGRNWL